MVGSRAEGRRIDMDSVNFKNASLWTVYRDWKSDQQNTDQRWLHGDYKDAPYVLVWRLYESLARSRATGTPCWTAATT